MCVKRVLSQAREALHNSPISSIRDLEVEVLEDALVISGKVRSFYEKQMAQEAIRAVCDDLQLRNSVDVSR